MMIVDAVVAPPVKRSRAFKVWLFVAWLVGRVYSAYMLRTVWGWFLVPLGVRPITLAWAVGIDVLVTWIMTNYGDVYWMTRTSRHYNPTGYQHEFSLTTSQGLMVSYSLTTFCFAYGLVMHWLMLRGW